MELLTEKMIDALHAVFWYENLLNEVYDSDPIEYADNCWLLKFIKDLRENDKTKYKDWYTTDDLESMQVFDDIQFDWEERHCVIWQMLVEMFGSCGTSPRTGWIEKRKECADFLEMVVNAKCVN